jgi:hypothetical protein
MQDGTKLRLRLDLRAVDPAKVRATVSPHDLARFFIFFKNVALVADKIVLLSNSVMAIPNPRCGPREAPENSTPGGAAVDWH